MKKIITSALMLALTIGAAQAQDSSARKDKHHQKREHRMGGFDKLNLTADQKERMKAIREEYKTKSEALRKQDQLTVAEMKARREELHKSFRTQTESVLTADQKAQLEKVKAEKKAAGKEGKFERGEGRRGRSEIRDEISKRGKLKGREGIRQKRAELRKELNLTAEQKEKMVSANAELKTRMTALKSDKSLTKEQKRAKIQELVKNRREQFKSILTKEQAEKLQALRKERSSRNTR
jgi:Spy/CpxP family protein refolding chaperone